jgi:excisionase family DNA binding protein
MSALSPEPLAVPPSVAAYMLAVSRRTVSRLIRSRKLAARKLGKRTLVDVESLKAFYATIPAKSPDGPPLAFGERAHVRPRPRPRDASKVVA